MIRAMCSCHQAACQSRWKIRAGPVGLRQHQWHQLVGLAEPVRYGDLGLLDAAGLDGVHDADLDAQLDEIAKEETALEAQIAELGGSGPAPCPPPSASGRDDDLWSVHAGTHAGDQDFDQSPLQFPRDRFVEPLPKLRQERLGRTDVRASAVTLAEVEKREWKYILGVRMRSSTEAKAVVARAGRYAEVHPKSDDRDDPSPLKVKEVWVEGARRYVVCVNEDQATKDRHDREAVVASLRDALGKGDKSLVGNKGYRKYLRAGGKQFAVDEDKIKEEARYDGKWVLTTNMDLPPREVALKYKQLWMVEDVFRSMKSLLDTRPIFHKCDETIRGHVFCSFLALLLRKELEDRLARKEWKLEWADVIRDLGNIVEMEVAISGKGYVFRG